MTRHRAGSVNGVPFAIDRDEKGAESTYVCLDCGMETAPSTTDFMKTHGSKCKPKEETATKKTAPAEKSAAAKKK